MTQPARPTRHVTNQEGSQTENPGPVIRTGLIWPPGPQGRWLADWLAGLRAPEPMSGRRALLAMFALFFVGAAVAGWLQLGFLTGFSFAAGCVLAARFARRSALLAVLVSPPLIFLIAVVCAETVSSSGASSGHAGLLSAAEGTILTLAAAAPWLFGGEALALIVAMFRGLPQCISDLGAGLRGEDPAHAADWGAPGRTS